jgi:hypothetical protein
MGSGPSAFKKADVKRALQAATAAGIEVKRVVIDKAGKIVIVAGKPEEEKLDEDSGGNEWDGI